MESRNGFNRRIVTGTKDCNGSVELYTGTNPTIYT